MSETKDNIREVRGTVLEIASKYLSADEISARMDDVLSIDSLDLIEIVVDIERAFQITFANEEVQSVESFDELIAMINRKLEGLLVS